MPENEITKAWNIQGIQEALHAEIQIAEDETHGVGVQFDLGDTGTTLIVFPHSHLVYARVKDKQHEMPGMHSIVIDETGVIFESDQGPPRDKLIVNANGDVFTASYPFSIVSHITEAGVERAAIAPAVAEAPPSPTLRETRPAGLSAPVPEESSEVEETATREKLEKIEVWGNVGYEPKFSVFKSGGSRLQFSVSQHMDDGKTTIWHTVKAFGGRARKYNGMAHRSDSVKVVGGKATETIKGKGGVETQRPFILLWGMQVMGRK